MTKPRLVLLLMALLLTGLAIGTNSVHANTPPPWTVSLDADSTSTTDTNIQPTNNATRSLAVGAIINASSAHPVTNIYAWQFAITYDNTSLAPSGIPVQFGSQSTAGHPNWAGQVTAGRGFGSSTQSSADTTHRKITVFFTLLGQNPPVSISPTIQGDLLANVNFTVLPNPHNPLTLAITDTQFLDNTTAMIPDINNGPPITENVSSNSTTQNQNPTGATIPYIIILPALIAVFIIALLTLLVTRRRKHSGATPS